MSLSSIYPLSKVVRPAHRARATAPNHFPIVPTGDIARAFCEHRAAEIDAAGGLDDRDHPTISVPLDRHDGDPGAHRSEEHTSELQSLMRTSYAVFCLKTKT